MSATHILLSFMQIQLATYFVTYTETVAGKNYIVFEFRASLSEEDRKIMEESDPLVKKKNKNEYEQNLMSQRARPMRLLSTLWGLFLRSTFFAEYTAELEARKLKASPSKRYTYFTKL
jgi:hypothetical protein